MIDLMIVTLNIALALMIGIVAFIALFAWFVLIWLIVAACKPRRET